MFAEMNHMFNCLGVKFKKHLRGAGGPGPGGITRQHEHALPESRTGRGSGGALGSMSAVVTGDNHLATLKSVSVAYTP